MHDFIILQYEQWKSVDIVILVFKAYSFYVYFMVYNKDIFWRAYVFDIYQRQLKQLKKAE